MKIRIEERLKPFSHRPGAQCVIPGTHFVLEAFPTLLRIGSLEIPLEGKLSPKEFVVQQDLEKNCVWVIRKKDRISVSASAEGFEVIIGEQRRFFSQPLSFFIPLEWERLSFGSQKSQDWDLVLRRFDLKEILPILYGLGQKIPKLLPQPLTGTGRFLEQDPLDFESLCRSAFHHILVPRLNDEEYLGLCPREEPQGSPFYLIQEATGKLRSFFIHQEKERISLLSNPLFDAGRMTHVQLSEGGSFDFEWRKRRIHRAILRPSVDQTLQFDFSDGTESFRLRLTDREKGRRRWARDPVSLTAGQTYFLDRFHTNDNNSKTF